MSSAAEARVSDDPLAYCRDIEAYLCRKNDGHLIRVVGPSFEAVAAWLHDGIPFKVACQGIDRYFERYYRKGPRRRPVRVEFCDADVRDVFDEWRRATGLLAGSAAPAAGASESRKGTSLPEHLERALLRLTNARATGKVGDPFDAIIDAVSSLLDEAKAASGGLRGAKRQALLERLAALDERLALMAAAAADDRLRADFAREVDDELAGFRADMPVDRFEKARATALDRRIRASLGLPLLRHS
jgi:hypothetical protein